MKTPLLLIGSLFIVASQANAQTNSGFYGLVDAGLTYVNNQGGNSSVILDTGIMQANRFGWRGTEDLGGGLKALYQLEGGFALDTGVLGQGGAIFGRTAAVGLLGTWGTVTLGRQYDFMLDNIVLKSSGAVFAGVYGFRRLDIDRIAGEQFNNAIKFVSPNYAGFTAGILYGLSEVPGAAGGAPNAPRTESAGVNYASGPLNLGLAYTNVNGSGGSLAESVLGANAMRHYGFGASYGFASGLLFGNATNTRASVEAGNKSTVVDNYEVGYNYKTSPATTVGLAYTYSRWDVTKYNQINLAGHYFLSKRTDVYAGAYYQKSSDINAPVGMFLIVNPATNKGYSSNENQLALRIGMRHTF